MPSFLNGATPDVALHVLDAGKEILVVGARFAHHVVDVVIMSTSTCFLDLIKQYKKFDIFKILFI